MFKRKEYSERVPKTLNFESRIYSDFESFCLEQKTYPSHILQEYMISVLSQKKGEGETVKDSNIHRSPLQQISCILNDNNTFLQQRPQQMDLLDWLDIIPGLRTQKETNKVAAHAQAIVESAQRHSNLLRKQGIKE